MCLCIFLTGISESEDQAQQNIHAELKPTAALFAVQPMGNVEVGLIIYSICIYILVCFWIRFINSM